MKLGLRSKLFLTSVVLIIAVGGISSLYLEGTLRELFEEQVQSSLVNSVRSAQVAVEESTSLSSERADELADTLGLALNARVTIVASDGRPLGDSELSAADVVAMDNHGDRPEIVSAANSGLGVARRYSTTLRTDMLYVAVPFEHGEQSGVVRVALSLVAVDGMVSQLRRLILGAGFIGLIVALFMSGLASHFLSRELRSLLLETRKRLEARKLRGSVRGIHETDDEVEGLALSVNALVDNFEKQVDLLAEQHDRFEAVTEGLGEGVVLLNETNQVVLLNETARTLLVRDDAMLGESILETIRTPEFQKLLEVIDGGDAADCEIERPNGVWLEAHTIGRRPSGNAVIVLRDVTRVRMLETVRRDFVANVSHELRTPAAVIQANSETLLDGALEDEASAKRFVAAIHRHSTRLSALLSDLLDISRLEAGQVTLCAEDVSIDEVTQSVVDAVCEPAEKRQVSLSRDFSHDVVVAADRKAVEQVLRNLVENAVKYTPDGGEVAIRFARKGHFGRIEVDDNGPGIEPSHRDRVFERFYRVDPGRSRDRGGTGLGLSIAKHLTTAMGGEIGVTERPGGGARFWVNLPLQTNDGSTGT